MRSIILTVLVGILAISCGKEKKNDKEKECNISTVEFTAPSNGNLAYSVTLRGLGKVTSITYFGTNGPLTESNPVLPFQVLLPVEKGALIKVSVVGTLSKGGNISAGYLFLDSQWINPIEMVTFCTN